MSTIHQNIAINVDSDADLTDGPLKGSTNLKVQNKVMKGKN